MLVWKPPRLLKVPNPLPSQTSSEKSAAGILPAVNFNVCRIMQRQPVHPKVHRGTRHLPSWQNVSVCGVNMHDTHSTESHAGHLSGTFTKRKKWMCTKGNSPQCALNLNKLWHSQCHLMMSCTGHKRPQSAQLGGKYTNDTIASPT